MASAQKPHVVIIGSGWAGFETANDLNYDRYVVTVISPRRTTAYTPLLASAACGLFSFGLAEEPVRSKSRRIRFIKAVSTGIDFENRKVHCSPAFDEDEELAKQEFDVEYDRLILAPGCIPNTFGTPGVAEHALFMKNVSDAMAVRKLLFDLLEKASLPHVPEQRARELLHIAIVGGGPTGVEMAAEIYDLAHHELKDTYPEVAPFLHISIYDVAPIILSSYDQKLHEYANKSLVRRDIGIKTSTHIEKVDHDALYTKEQGRTPYGMLIWATGNKEIPLIEKLHVRKPPKGLKRILTDHHLRVYRSNEDDSIYEDVWAIGDAADIDGASLPTTAEVAVQKAKYLSAWFNHEDTSTESRYNGPFKYKQKQLVSYIGGHDGVVEGKENKEGWTGSSAWLAWRGGSITWVRSWRHRFMIAMNFVINYALGPDITRL